MSTKEINFGTFTWVNIPRPTKHEIEALDKKYHFHHLALEDCLSSIQRPKIDEYGDYLFMVFHIPKYLKDINRTVALEVNVFLGKSFLITIHDGTLVPLNNLWDECQNNSGDLKSESPAYLLYEILKQSFEHCLPMLDKIAQKLDKAEDSLYEDQSRKTLEDISLIQQDIINFRRIINPQRFVLKDLEAMKGKIIGKNLDVYFDDIGDTIERIWELLDNYKEVCQVLQNTNESILTQRLNEVMKILTIFSVIMLPLTVITGFYGMNVVGLPAADHKFASEIITTGLILVILGMLIFFKKRRWL